MSLSRELATALQGWRDEQPRLAVILGSGFGAAAAAWPVLRQVSYGDLPGFPPCGVEGHRGEMDLVRTASGPALVFRGRLHAYEGHALAKVILPVDVAAFLGARTLLLTCAAGGIREDLQPGDLAIIEDHLNLTGETPSLAPAGFVDLTRAYSAPLRRLLQDLARRDGLSLPGAVLAGVRGPAYETPAEVRMLERLGADLVSMSTIPEVLRARALGLEVAALACVANRAAGLSDEQPRHERVLDRVQQTVTRRAAWIKKAVEGLAAAAAEGGVVPAASR